MKITISDRVGLFLRKIPANKIVPAYESAAKSGISLSIAQLEAHFLSGGDPIKAVEACILATENGIDADFMATCSIDLTGNDPVRVIKVCMELNSYSFDTFSPNLPDKIIGHCRDGSEVHAVCKVTYNLPVAHVWGWTPDLLHLHLSAKIALSINTSGSFNELQFNKLSNEASLFRTASDMLPSSKKVELLYTKI